MITGIFTNPIERSKKISEKLKGKHRINDVTFKKGHKSWITGLTKETDERIAKYSKKLKGREFTWGDKISKSLTGKKQSEETKRKHSETNIKKGIGKWNKGNMKPGQGFQKGHKGFSRMNQKGWSHKESTKEIMKLKHSMNINSEKLIEQEKIAGRKRPDNCEICGSMGKMYFDHCHKTGKFRGWICMRCNLALGLVKDNSETLIIMSEYLIKSNI